MNISRKNFENNYFRLYDMEKTNGMLFLDKTLNNETLIKVFKSDKLIANRYRVINYLLKYPFISNSGYPKERFNINNVFCGYISDYYKDSCDFKLLGDNNKKFSFEEKKQAIKDIDRQLKELHKRDVIFHDINLSNLLIDKKAGHLVDFEDVFCCDSIITTPVKYKIFYGDKLLTSSKKVDQLKFLLSSLTLIYGVNFETYFSYSNIQDLLNCFKEDKIIYDFIISCFFVVNNKICDTLPYLGSFIDELEEDKVEFKKKSCILTKRC